MKDADWLVVAWSLTVRATDDQLKNENCDSNVAARTHSQYKKNVRSGLVRLSKIAHM